MSILLLLCVVIDCSKGSEGDKVVFLHKIPKIVTHSGRQDYELMKIRRAELLTVISREEIRDSQVLKKDGICS